MLEYDMYRIEQLYQWIIALFSEHAGLLALIGIGSLLLFVGTILAMPLLIVSIPRDYFLYEKAEPFGFYKRHPVIRLVMLVLKNGAGIVLLVAGFVMLFIPGQGLLTMFIGLMLMNFPGKRRLELWLVTYPQIQHGINWIRRRAGREPLQLPE